MNMTLQVLPEKHRLYTYAQSQQIYGQTGCIGHLRGDMDSNGTGFFTSWDNHCESLKTDAFKSEFDTVINMLRFDERYGGILKNRSSMAGYCYGKPESGFDGNYCREYAFRADTDNYSYLMRLNPNKGDYNFYIYAYQREWLDRHLKNAEKGIRFARPVPIWEYKPEYEAAVIEALENRFGELRDKSDLQSALHSVAKNAVEDNLPDYLSELIRYRADSFLEDYDDLNVEVIYRRLLENSVAYMLMSRCGLDVDEYFEVDDFNDIINFNSPDTMNTLGVSTSDIAENCLGAIALTVRNLQREEKEENRTFAENAEKEYPIVSKPKTMSERSIEDGTDLHDEAYPRTA